MNIIIKLVNFLQSLFLKTLRFFALIQSAVRRLEYPEFKNRRLVIDVGGGGLPNPYAHVVVEAFPSDKERATKLRLDRQTVWAYAENLPFKDQIFSYSIMSHVLEHLYKPGEALKELERISAAGYIETPNTLFETAVSHFYHVSFCDVICDQLIIRPKKTWDEKIVSTPLLEQITDYFNIVNHYFPNKNLTRFGWVEKINYKVLEGRFFEKNEEILNQNIVYSTRNPIKRIIIEAIYKILSPKKIKIESILACPICKGELMFSNVTCTCKTCAKTYGKLMEFYDFRQPLNNY